MTMVSCRQVALAAHLKAGDGGLVAGAVRQEGSVLVRLLLVYLFNVLWTIGAHQE